ncbi:hypothetical protein CDD83_654 [Cordyceps sp. RAO-2017]|nr:hypothetical protein CDD83_654 [Cordyceps sp. RAO-2017]
MGSTTPPSLVANSPEPVTLKVDERGACPLGRVREAWIRARIERLCSTGMSLHPAELASQHVHYNVDTDYAREELKHRNPPTHGHYKRDIPEPVFKLFLRLRTGWSASPGSPTNRCTQRLPAVDVAEVPVLDLIFAWRSGRAQDDARSSPMCAVHVDVCSLIETPRVENQVGGMRRSPCMGGRIALGLPFACPPRLCLCMASVLDASRASAPSREPSAPSSQPSAPSALS